LCQSMPTIGIIWILSFDLSAIIKGPTVLSAKRQARRYRIIEWPRAFITCSSFVSWGLDLQSWSIIRKGWRDLAPEWPPSSLTTNDRDLLCRYMRLPKAAARQANEKPSGWLYGRYFDKAERCRPEEHDFLFAVRQYEIGRTLNRSTARLFSRIMSQNGNKLQGVIWVSQFRMESPELLLLFLSRP
jgi:hypothetical protein